MKNMNMTPAKSLSVPKLVNKTLKDLKIEYGDNITSKSIGTDIIELIEGLTGIQFKNCDSHIILNYYGKKFDLMVKIFVNGSKYEIISDLTAKACGDVESNIIYLSKFSSVLDYLTTDLLTYVGK